PFGVRIRPLGSDEKPGRRSCASPHLPASAKSRVRGDMNRVALGRRRLPLQPCFTQLAFTNVRGASMARTRYSSSGMEFSLRQLPAAALRAVLREGYSAQDLRADMVAGLVVGVVALPLAMALAIAVGVAPQYGLATAIVAG